MLCWRCLSMALLQPTSEIRNPSSEVRRLVAAESTRGCYSHEWTPQASKSYVASRTSCEMLVLHTHWVLLWKRCVRILTTTWVRCTTSARSADWQG